MKQLVSMLIESKKSDKKTKMDPKDKDNVVALAEIIDTWRLIDKYDIRWYTDQEEYPDTVFVNKEDWEAAKDSASNPKYFDVCLKNGARMRGHNYNTIS